MHWKTDYYNQIISKYITNFKIIYHIENTLPNDFKITDSKVRF